MTTSITANTFGGYQVKTVTKRNNNEQEPKSHQHLFAEFHTSLHILKKSSS